jgi:hypothetical protein
MSKFIAIAIALLAVFVALASAEVCILSLFLNSFFGTALV